MKNQNINKKNNSGLSLIEILIVITIFAVLGVIVSASLILTIQGTKKSESQIRVRENVNYSLAVIERNIRNANAIVDCTNSDTSTVTYLDQDGVSSSFSCVNTGSVDSYIASGSARITSNAISILACTFNCDQPTDLTSPPLITVEVIAKDALATGIQGASVSAQTKIYLRN
jgi:prepilin-type N-terminal cleavage/methylation domain-containing protein